MQQWALSIVKPNCRLDSGSTTCSVLLTTLNNVGSTTLFNPVFNNLQQHGCQAKLNGNICYLYSMSDLCNMTMITKIPGVTWATEIIETTYTTMVTKLTKITTVAGIRDNMHYNDNNIQGNVSGLWLVDSSAVNRKHHPEQCKNL